jgi:hypothetical protein
VPACGLPVTRPLLNAHSILRPCAVTLVLSRCWHVGGDAATSAGMKRIELQRSSPANDAISYSGYRFPPEVISYAVWLYCRFPLSLRMVEELLAARGGGPIGWRVGPK